MASLDPIRSGWVSTGWVVANLLFLSGVYAYSGASSPIIVSARLREPEITDLLDAVPQKQLRSATLREALGPIWPEVVRAAQRRQHRIGG